MTDVILSFIITLSDIVNDGVSYGWEIVIKSIGNFLRVVYIVSLILNELIVPWWLLFPVSFFIIAHVIFYSFSFDIHSSFCVFLAALMIFGSPIIYFLSIFNFLSLLFLQFKYNILLLWRDILIPLVFQALY